MAGTKRGGTAAFSSRPLFFRPFSPWLAACTKALTFHITGRFILICIYMLNDGNPREGWFLKNDRG